MGWLRSAVAAAAMLAVPGSEAAAGVLDAHAACEWMHKASEHIGEPVTFRGEFDFEDVDHTGIPFNLARIANIRLEETRPL